MPKRIGRTVIVRGRRIEPLRTRRDNQQIRERERTTTRPIPRRVMSSLPSSARSDQREHVLVKERLQFRPPGAALNEGRARPLPHLSPLARQAGRLLLKARDHTRPPRAENPGAREEVRRVTGGVRTKKTGPSPTEIMDEAGNGLSRPPPGAHAHRAGSGGTRACAVLRAGTRSRSAYAQSSEAEEGRGCSISDRELRSKF